MSKKSLITFVLVLSLVGSIGMPGVSLGQGLVAESNGWEIVSNPQDRLCVATKVYPNGSQLFVVIWEDKFNLSYLDEFMRFEAGFEEYLSLSVGHVKGVPFQVSRPYINQFTAHFTFGNPNNLQFYRALGFEEHLLLTFYEQHLAIPVGGFIDAKKLLENCLREIL